MRRLSLLAGQHQRGRFLTFHATVKASQWFKQKQVGAPTSPRQSHWFSTCPLTIKMLTASLHQKQTFPSASILALPTIWCQRFFKLWFGLVNNCSSCWSFPQMNFRRDSTTTPPQQETPSTAPACLQGKEGQQLQISCVHKSKASCSSWNATKKMCLRLSTKWKEAAKCVTNIMDANHCSLCFVLLKFNKCWLWPFDVAKAMLIMSWGRSKPAMTMCLVESSDTWDATILSMTTEMKGDLSHAWQR